MSHFLHWTMIFFSQPVFSLSWNEAAIGVFRGSNPPRFHMVCSPWGWNGLPWEMLSWGPCWGSQQYRGQHRSTGWKTWHGILFNENNCVDSIGNQSPFSLPAGSGSYQLCQSSSVSLLPACFQMWGMFWGQWFSLCTPSVCWRTSALLLPFCCQQLILDTGPGID